MSLSIGLLGDLTIRHHGVPLPLGSRRRTCLLAVLLLHHGRTVPRADLAEWAWPSVPPDTVDRQIANYASGLRRALEPVGDRIRLLARRPGFSVQVDPALLDTERFAVLVEQARAARRERESGIAADRLREALALWRGRPLDGLDTPYLRQHAERLEGRRREAALTLAEIEGELDRPAEAVALLHDLAVGHPGDEAVTAALVRALTGAGRTAEAARMASHAERSLIREGRLPTPALRRAHSDALAGRAADGPAPSDPPRRHLPVDTGAFTGRAGELAELARLAGRVRAGDRPGAPVICAIDGMGGVGKTALAVHAAHRLADRFPDGQLYLELRTHSADASPRTAFDALGTALATLGLPPRSVPNDLDARAARYRALLSGTRTLIVLDDVADEAQARALLPGHAGCLVLVTSRRRLKALDDAEALSLGTLPVADATELFRTTAGVKRLAAGDERLRQAVELCGRLPLALRVAAALLRHRRTWQLDDLLAELRDDQAELEAFDDGERNLAATFDMSYHHLSAEQRTLFRRLGHVPGPDLDAYAAAALLDVGLRAARRLLYELVDHNLLSESAPGRFRLHDLLREYARSRAAHEEAGPGRRAALERLFAYYRHTAGSADRHLRTLPADHPAPAPAPRHHPSLNDREAAERWMAAEIDNLLAASRQAAAHAGPDGAVAPPAALASYLYHRGPWPRALELHAAAADLAGTGHDPRGRAAALVEVGRLRQLTGEYSGAIDSLTRALDLYRDLDRPLGQANALTELGRVRMHTADYPGATRACTRALRLYGLLDNALGQANALMVLGRVRQLTGDYSDAAADLTRGLRLHRQVGNEAGQALALRELGAVRFLTGDYQEAAEDFDRALLLCGRLDNPLGQANALTALAIVRRRTGDYPGAEEAGGRALRLYRRLDNPLGQASTLTERGTVRYLTRDHAGATEDLTRALLLYRRLDQPSGQAIASTHLGTVKSLVGDHTGALADLDEALRGFRESGERGNEAWTLTHYAAALRAAGRTGEALGAYRQAVGMNRELDKRDDEAAALEGVGGILLDTGHTAEGTSHLHQALDIFRLLGMAPDVRRVEDRLK
ncbi:tetratricopeptide repeat protein [Streptomyces sp. PTM05]|uniref:Tetratricopeptide repeat protein n=1 Tax=Streptantibioticus parmotrematis TaxID=2873249 RepID=A0ABS7R0S3_9ACTN|nr:tetratricopeptide repeat protein [Streptantibioticus parmotrematis]MBY8889057.1 tetratricopeptide repeat protein [Streptantibioticus parmotrematis]